MQRHRRRPQAVHPFALPLLALVAMGIAGLVYWLFGIGKDAFTYLLAALVVIGLPVVIVFGVAGLVLGIRRLFRWTK
jgi:peptidoglycan/LPS O-acetylase OafA/YrhL